MIYLKAYTRLNLGDDLLIKKICDQYPNEKFYLLADRKYKNVFRNQKNLKVMSTFYKIINKNKNEYSRYLKIKIKILKYISKKCDTFLYVGGSIFIENSSASLSRVKELKEEIELFNNSYIVDSNFGPYINKEYFNYIHDELIPILTHITFRDLYSYNLFKSRENVSYAPDIIFSIDKEQVTINKKKEIGISLINHLERKELKDNYDEYLTQVANLAKDYIDKGFKVRVLSFCSYEKDTLAIEDFMKKIPVDYKNSINIDNYDGDINNFLKIFSEIDTIIATRFHAIVLGLKYCCNVIPICYNNKTVNMLNDLGIKEIITFNNIKELSVIKPIKFSNKKILEVSKASNSHFEILIK